MGRLLIVFLSIVFADFGFSASTFYVATNGNDSWNGTSSNFVSGSTGPWLTIGHSASGRVPGDAVIVEPGNYPERVTVVASGTSGSNIVFQSLPLLTATMKGFYLNGSDYVTINGFNISNTNSFLVAAGAASGIYIAGNNDQIVNNYIYSNSTYGVSLERIPSSTGNLIYSNTFYMVGSGIKTVRPCLNLVIQNNEISRLFNFLGGSTVNSHNDQDYLGASGINILISSNYLHGTFFNEISYEILSGGNPIACTNDADCRTKSGDATAFMDWNGFARDYSHVDGCEIGQATNVIYEFNRVYDSTSLIKAEHDPGTVAYSDLIVRGNISIQGGGILMQTHHVWCYNNTFCVFDGHGINFETADQAGGSLIAKNNIFYSGDRVYTTALASCPTNFLEANTLATGYVNLFWAPCTTNAATATLLGANPLFVSSPVLMFEAGSSARIYISSLASNIVSLHVNSGNPPAMLIGDVLEYHQDGVARTVTATNYSAGIFTATFSPVITNNPSLWDGKIFVDWGASFSVFDSSITSGSPAKNAGTFLTTIASSSGSGALFDVNDSLYFNPGWNSGTVVPGDTIQLQGQTATVKITGISNNTITVDSSLTWTNGQGVALTYAGPAPDIGAFEYPSFPTSVIQYRTRRSPIKTSR